MYYMFAQAACCWQEVAQQCQIRAMPTFHVYSQGQKAEEIVGGNLNALKAACEKYGKASQVFQGTGHTLSGQAVLNGIKPV